MAAFKSKRQQHILKHNNENVEGLIQHHTLVADWLQDCLIKQRAGECLQYSDI